jgi:hypothetical protein
MNLKNTKKYYTLEDKGEESFSRGFKPECFKIFDNFNNWNKSLFKFHHH